MIRPWPGPMALATIAAAFASITPNLLAAEAVMEPIAVAVGWPDRARCPMVPGCS